jgi:type II secretory pathway pseudopilin PulG
MEMVVVTAIIGLMVGISLPSITAGLDSVRISTAADSMVSFLNAAVNRADRHQQPIELVISQKDNLLSLYSNEPGFHRELKMPDGVAIESIEPAAQPEMDGLRRVIFMPGGTVAGIAIGIGNQHGSHRIVRLDPMTGFPRVESVEKK